MIYAKSVLAGVVALIVAALIGCVLFFGGLGLKLLTDGGAFVVVHWHLWRALAISLLIFATGFCWQYRRAR
jgi:hypothetical protein